MKELRVEVPQGYEIDKENSTFECIKFKPVRDIKTTEDLIETGGQMYGYWINDDAEICESYSLCYREYNNNVFLSEKEARSALAMAQISQLMPYYGGVVTNEDWEDKGMRKFVIVRRRNKALFDIAYTFYRYLAFYTEEQRDSFYKNNEQLVKDYLMLD